MRRKDNQRDKDVHILIRRLITMFEQTIDVVEVVWQADFDTTGQRKRRRSAAFDSSNNREPKRRRVLRDRNELLRQRSLIPPLITPLNLRVMPQIQDGLLVFYWEGLAGLEFGSGVY